MPTTLEYMFTNYFDITSPPTMKMLMQLAMYCTSEDECEQLKDLTKVLQTLFLAFVLDAVDLH